MKNTTKISLMSGLIFAGMALGGIHIANAQNNVNPEIDNSRYTVMIPSEVNIDKNTGKGSFAVTGKVKAQSTIDVSIQSKNGYKLKDKNGELPYNIDKKSFSIDNSRSASDIPLNEEFNIASKTNTKVSGYYTDSLTFDITSESYKYRLDVNGNLDDNGIGDGRLDDFGRFDVYLNGKLVKENVEDFCEPIPYGTTWEIKNIRSLDGYRYKDGEKLTIRFLANKDKDSLDSLIPVLQKCLNAIGIDFKANTVEFNTVINTVQDDAQTDSWDATYLGFSYGSPDDTGINFILRTGATSNFGRLSDEQLDTYLDAGMYTSDNEVSKENYHNALVRQSELCGYLPVDSTKTYCFRNKNIKGMHTTSIYNWAQSIATAYIVNK